MAAHECFSLVRLEAEEMMCRVLNTENCEKQIGTVSEPLGTAVATSHSLSHSINPVFFPQLSQTCMPNEMREIEFEHWMTTIHDDVRRKKRREIYIVVIEAESRRPRGRYLDEFG